MNGWIIYSKEDYARNEWFANECIKSAEKIGMQLELKYSDEIFAANTENKNVIFEKDRMCHVPEFAIVRTIVPGITKCLEETGCRCFNNSYVSHICNDKSKSYSVMAKNNIATIPTVYTSFDRMSSAIKIIAGSFFSKEIVIKTVDGHGGKQVFLYDTNQNVSLDKLIPNELYHKSFCVQPRIGSKCLDLRVYILGNNIYASVLRKSESGFKANFCLGGSMSPFKLSNEQKDYVMNISDIIKPDFAGIDFIIDDSGNLIFNEMEDVVGTRMLFASGNQSVCDDYLTYIKRIMRY